MDAQAQVASLKGSIRLGNYLRRLRAGYGYSLRRVEERARAEGGEIDNSQLSRYEKGVCYPSFDKLRVLASVFNVSMQAFSDVVDLEDYEDLKPADGEPRALVADGNDAMKSGDFGRAFALYELAVETLVDQQGSAARDELLGQARVNLAMALTRLGKLALAEQELRHALRHADDLDPKIGARALLNLANLHADLGDLLLAEIEADRAHGQALSLGLDLLAARAVHTTGRILSQRRRFAEAIDRYREACRLYEAVGETPDILRTRINIGDCFVGMGKTREGIRLLRGALADARAAGFRRLEAQAWSNLGEAHYRQNEPAQAQGCFRQSDALSNTSHDRYADILFFNAYYEWKMAGEQGNPTREKIAFGRLKALRSSLERRIPEAEAFDQYVERGRDHA